MKKLGRKIIKKIDNIFEKAIWSFLIIVIFNLNLPHVSLAKTLAVPVVKDEQSIMVVDILVNEKIKLPETEELKPKHVEKIWVTTYNSLPSQTDASPCITASGLNVCERNTEDIIATNFLNLPFGTKVRLPELFGDRIFIVEDRMNRRYYRTADVWLKDYNDAKKFGRKRTTIEVF